VLRRGVLTVHIPLVLVLDEGVAAWLPGALVVDHIDLKKGCRNRRQVSPRQRVLFGGGVGGGRPRSYPLDGAVDLEFASQLRLRRVVVLPG